MAEHAVWLKQTPEVEIVNKDLIVEVASDGEVLGKLTISRGGLGWFPKNAEYERHLSWERFDRLVRSEFG
ncbi:MAG: hypothetical protein DCC68_10820 [Planctomycetota bacterium]|nr:MAG: hypothetical protein DCC68_10820 [Planctomycetota bacterium]